MKSLKLNNTKALVFVHDCVSEDIAITRTTDLCIAAHQDDIEIMAYSPIVKCFGKSDKWFTGVVVTDGAGSPRSGIYEKQQQPLANIRHSYCLLIQAKK